LYVDEKLMGEAPFRTQSGHYAICGEGLCIGYDSGDPVSRDYKYKFSFTGGEILKVVYDLGNDAYINLEREFALALARE
jgi:arylsulfatase